MKLQRRIFWTTLVISVISLVGYILLMTIWGNMSGQAILSNIAISLFGSSLLVFVPAMITFYKNKSEAKQKIISELSKVENLINDIQFQTTFLKDFDGNYNLDFSFEKKKYELVDNIKEYNIQKEIYELNSKKVEKLFDSIKKIDDYDYSFFDTYVFEFVDLFHNEKLIYKLADLYLKILNNFMISNFQIPYEYGARQFEFCNALVGQFFDIWFKKFIIELEPIYEKLENLRAILLIFKLKFYRKAYKDTIKSNENDKKIQLKELIEKLYNSNNISKCRWVKNLLKKLQ